MQHRRRPRVMVPMSRIALGLVATLLASCSGAPPSQAPARSDPAASPSAVASERPAGLTGQLAYVAGQDPQIHLLDLATGEARQLTELRPEHAELEAVGPMRPVLSCGFGPYSLTWSPDGAYLAFTYGACDTVVYIVDVEGNLRRIGDGRSPEWSPDGASLLYAANVPWCPGVGCEPPGDLGPLDLQVADIEAAGPARSLTANGETRGAGGPAWSPDGTTIAYAGEPLGGGMDVFSATYVIAANGGAPRHVGDGFHPAGWHPDGRLLATMERDGSVRAIDLATGDSVRIGPAQTASVSPDATLVMVWATDPATGEGRSQLFAAGGELVAELDGQFLAWAPRSDAAAVTTPVGIAIVRRDGTLTGGVEVDFGGFGGGPGAWRPGS